MNGRDQGKELQLQLPLQQTRRTPPIQQLQCHKIITAEQGITAPYVSTSNSHNELNSLNLANTSLKTIRTESTNIKEGNHAPSLGKSTRKRWSEEEEGTSHSLRTPRHFPVTPFAVKPSSPLGLRFLLHWWPPVNTVTSRPCLGQAEEADVHKLQRVFSRSQIASVALFSTLFNFKYTF